VGVLISMCATPRRSTNRSGTPYRLVCSCSRSPRHPQFYLQGRHRLEPRQTLARSPVVRRSWRVMRTAPAITPITAPSRQSGRSLRTQSYPTASALAASRWAAGHANAIVRCPCTHLRVTVVSRQSRQWKIPPPAGKHHPGWR
jgi:hypothetical protein